MVKNWTPYQYAKIGSALAMAYKSAYTPKTTSGPSGPVHSNKGHIVYQRRRPRAKRNTFRKRLLNNIPAKHYSVALSQSPMTHSTLYTFMPTAGVTQGDAINNRDGDSIDIVGLRMKGFVQTAASSNTYSYRIIIGWTGEEYLGLGSNFGSGLGTSELFHPNTSNNWSPNGVINPKTFTCIYDETIDISSQIADIVDLSSFDIKLSLNDRFNYQSSGSVFGKMKNLVVVVVAGIQGGVAGTTAAGAFYAGFDLIFK